MEAKDILDKKFDKGFNGYKMEEVDDFLQEVSSSFSELKKQNEELEKKMEVLADKIREYRKDEDSIKEAILGAQKQSSATLAAAKEKSEKLISDAKEKSEKLLKEADDKVKEKNEYAKKLVDDANEEKTKIIAERERKTAEIKAEMEAEIKKQESILAKTRNESKAYTEKLLKSYKEHIELIKAIPAKCENEFVTAAKDTIGEVPQKQPEAEAKTENKSEPKLEKVQAEPAKPDEPAKKAEETNLEKTSEIAFQPVFEEEAAVEDVEEYDGSENKDTPLFDKSKRKSKFEKLEFGSNNKNKE